jgi:hypothetical protein
MAFSKLRTAVATKLALLVAGVWGLCAWALLRPPLAVTDWMGWRQADTQTIALHLLEPGSSLLYPRIAWGGDGPGFVEAELQLYTGVTALLMRWFGAGEWAGQLVSLLCVGATLLVLAWHLERRHDVKAALFGIGAFLAVRSVPHAATAIQPEALCLVAYTGAWACFCRYAEGASRRWLVAFAVAGGIAMLVKPTAAQIGISSGVLLLISARHLLRRFEIWLAWGAMLVAFGAYLLHARELYLGHGNTFGILSGGDSKLPRLEHLLMLGPSYQAVKLAIVWGAGGVGALALGVLVVTREVRPSHYALLAGNAAWTLIALRYTSTDAYGSMYFVLGSVLSAELVAALVASPRWQGVWFQRGAAALVGVAVVATATLRYRSAHAHDDDTRATLSVGQALGEVAGASDLGVVRSPTHAYDVFWRTPNNFEDPRIFYISGTRGWVLGSDELEPSRLEALCAHGARYYVESARVDDAALEAWLSDNAELVTATPEGGRVFRIRNGRARGDS